MLDTLKNKNNLIALVGASNDPKKYGNKILLDLISKGYNVAPINNKEEMISGIKSYKNVMDLELSPSIINFVVPPNVGFEITKELCCMLKTKQKYKASEKNTKGLSN